MMKHNVPARMSTAATVIVGSRIHHPFLSPHRLFSSCQGPERYTLCERQTMHTAALSISIHVFALPSILADQENLPFSASPSFVPPSLPPLLLPGSQAALHAPPLPLPRRSIVSVQQASASPLMQYAALPRCYNWVARAKRGTAPYLGSGEGARREGKHFYSCRKTRQWQDSRAYLQTDIDPVCLLVSVYLFC